MSETHQRRNPLRLIVSRESQLHILWLVATGTFVAMVLILLVAAWLQNWIWITVLALAIGAFVSLWVSRQIAGPFYRIERDLEEILSEGSLGKVIHLRPGDPLQHLAGMVNQLAERAEALKSPPQRL